MILVKPSPEYLAAYVDALQRGWSHDTSSRSSTSRLEELALVESDPEAFFLRCDDPEGRAGPVALPDGTLVARLPGFRRWIWDGEFAGSIGLRWQPGTSELPPTCPGHIGYSVVPWKEGRGYATAALALILPEARLRGLKYVEITTGVANRASQRVIEKNGGVLIGQRNRGPAFHNDETLLYRITLT
ncbi:MAG TPA: GNAT family N-acetyltransferase [Candidatus Cybelea sp.]|nr:GNAT family N-acetyltransferase [Candidatus Cybelea sp.]